ncbi:MAG TPA: hypothetical protein VKB14_04910, partial [Actinomycetales bacterium]|nr:hypothetical protein [Actinomycetales bacterium]
VSDRRTAVGEAVPLEDAVPLGEAVPLMPGCCAGAASPEPVGCALVMGGFGDPSVSGPAVRTAGSRASPWPTAPQAPSRATAKTTTGGVARRLVGLTTVHHPSSRLRVAASMPGAGARCRQGARDTPSVTFAKPPRGFDTGASE